MDLAKTLRTKIDTLPQGDYLIGLRAVLVHIETSFKHLMRGQCQADHQAFTDAIYRTNQAFEGSIKEAYRVLAGKSPEKKTPFEIEAFLDKNSVFKPRVLAQFTTYRTQWRNPSSHDYTLSFDESEAFLAITSVCAFACVLIDQIAERVAFAQTSKDVETQQDRQCLPDRDEHATLVELLIVYLALFNKISLTLPIHSDSQLYGSIQGFLSSTAPYLTVSSDIELVPGRPERADLLVAHNDERVLVELLRSNTTEAAQQAFLHLEHSMTLAGIKDSLLYVYCPSAGPLQLFRRPFRGGRLSLLVPIAQQKAKADPIESPNENAGPTT